MLSIIPHPAEARKPVNTSFTVKLPPGVLGYLSRIPVEAPDDAVVVHNRVRPTRRLGSRGFRAWLAEPSDRLAVCDCGWAPELGEHYRVTPRCDQAPAS